MNHFNQGKKTATSYKDYLFHPTTIPHAFISLAILIFLLLFFAFGSSRPAWLMPAFGLFSCFMYGLSGVIAIFMGESASAQKGIVRGWRAYLQGSFQILLGWGFALCLAILLVK